MFSTWNVTHISTDKQMEYFVEASFDFKTALSHFG